MSLANLADPSRTDKNTTHSYLPLYTELFARLRTTAKNVLEIGIERGGSIALWNHYFENATIYGLDCMSYDNVWTELKKMDRVKLITDCDAYTVKPVSYFKHEGIKFDVIIDDGPHTLESMLIFVQNYLPLLSDNGILIVEDIPHDNFLPPLLLAIPPYMRKYATVHDLRPKKNRYDDIVLVIDLRDATTEKN
jgi:cephalosporin hydroxylase